jgi:hypothetical protein
MLCNAVTYLCTHDVIMCWAEKGAPIERVGLARRLNTLGCKTLRYVPVFAKERDRRYASVAGRYGEGSVPVDYAGRTSSLGRGHPRLLWD